VDPLPPCVFLEQQRIDSGVYSSQPLIMPTPSMEGPFPPYQGDDSYVFVSYSHDDGDALFAGLGN